MRADKVLHALLPQFSRSRIQKFLEDGRCWRDNEALLKSDKLRTGDAVIVEVPATVAAELRPVPMNLDVLFEDEHMLALNKPANLVVHPGAGTGENTLVHGLLHHCQGKLSGIGGVERPGIVHRLDKDTTGVMVIAKSDAAFTGLANAFAERTLHKEYLALVNGVPQLLCGSIKDPIGRHSGNRLKMAVITRGRDAHSDWYRQEVFGKRCALLRVVIHTGRTHQIRVHLSHNKHVILGDVLYGFHPHTPLEESITRPLLHSSKLVLNHPVTGEPMELIAPLPADFTSILETLRRESVA
ncbi:MAG: RluA family pseudouridine synthase [Verrucomicrobiota bacterium]|nr:RluA family pseudouridine synthase [Verrucomicrobiota bacterium]